MLKSDEVLIQARKQTHTHTQTLKTLDVTKKHSIWGDGLERNWRTKHHTSQKHSKTLKSTFLGVTVSKQKTKSVAT